ncbi:MAG: hypothetical protein IJA83_06420 [Clostridia bacterium]|nr:hypothetical protein [Clostridia bacterium]
MNLKALFTNMSVMRRRYALRLIGRSLILLTGVFFCIFDPAQFDILQGWNFFRSFSLLHLLWGVWVIDMAAQLFPLRTRISLGSQKLWQMRFQPLKEKFSVSALKKHIITTTRAAYKVMLLWVALIAAIGYLHYIGVMSDIALFMTTVIFYVCDLICVLIWCPFRLMMGNRCCTTCRIFNWDHLMMFSPLLFFPSFYCWSLLALSLLAWLVWELFIFLHPERFWEGANAALTCASCTDKLCTQYCRKLRPGQPDQK